MSTGTAEQVSPPPSPPSPPQKSVILAGAPLPTWARAAVAGARRKRKGRVVAVPAALVGLLVAAAAWSASTGSLGVGLTDLPAVLAGNGTAQEVYAVRSLRLPRTVAGAAVGAAFGMSGAIFQSLARNVLASPDLIGITSGASVSAVVVIVVIGETTALLTFGALGGSVLVAMVIYGLAHRNGLSPYRLVLVGIGMQAMLGAVITYLLAGASQREAERVQLWTIGSLANRTWAQVWLVVAVFAALAPVVVRLRTNLGAMQLGDEAAVALGVPVGRSRAALIAVAAMLAAAGVAAAGPIAFVAFTSAPIARRLLHVARPSPVVSALVGATLLVSADVLARNAFDGVDLPVGLLTGVLGAPVLVAMLVQTNRVRG